MHRAVAIVAVFLGGFAIMVLEIIGARFLGKDLAGPSTCGSVRSG